MAIGSKMQVLSLQEQLAAASSREEGLVRAKRALEEELRTSHAAFDGQVWELRIEMRVVPRVPWTVHVRRCAGSKRN